GHGDIPPSHFIPLAEETNLILDIGEWVLNRVCMDYRQLQSKGGDPGRISLNLSLKQLRQASFILRCRSVFRRHQASPPALELEFLRSNACHYGQGRLFGEPCTAEDLLGLLARQAAGSAPFAHLLQRADAVASRTA